MKIGIIGKTGQLGKALTARRPDAVLWGREDLDLSASPVTLRRFAQALPKLDVLINAAAHTQVDLAESEPEKAYHINAMAPAIFAEQCARRGIKFIHISTDCVFDGASKGAYGCDDVTRPINSYGWTKREGERLVRAHCPDSIILRTSWVFDGVSDNFLTKMIALAQSRPALRLVDDQIGRPTYAGHLADAVLAAAHHIYAKASGAGGIYHSAGGGTPVSRADFARKIFEGARLGPIIKTIPTSEFPTPAQRPLNSVLNISAFEKRFDHVMPDWTDGLRAALKEAGYGT